MEVCKKDLYAVLGVPRSASTEDIRGAYRKLALQLHPDKNPAHQAEAEKLFKEIHEAHDILTDPYKRAEYDLSSVSSTFTKPGCLDESVFDKLQRELFGSSHSSTNEADFDCCLDLTNSGASQPDYEQQFLELLSTSLSQQQSPSVMTSTFYSTSYTIPGELHCSFSQYTSYNTARKAHQAHSNPWSMNSSLDSRSHSSGSAQSASSHLSTGSGDPTGSHSSHHSQYSHTAESFKTQSQSPPNELHLSLSLEELYCGCTKKVDFVRTLYDSMHASPTHKQEVFKIDVKPGWKAGTRISFPGKGDQASPDQTPGDVVFTVSQQPHPTFQRHGNDLYANLPVPGSAAAEGLTVSLQTLDQRTVSFRMPHAEGVPGRFVVQGEGMPISKKPGQKGNLYIQLYWAAGA